MKKKFSERKIKNRYLIYIILCSFFFGSFLGILVHPGSAASFLLTDFESFSTGGTSGANPTMAFTRVSGNDFDIVAPGAPAYSPTKCLNLNDDSGESIGYINNTFYDNVTYMKWYMSYAFNIWMDTHNNELYIRNEANVNVGRVLFHTNGGTPSRFTLSIGLYNSAGIVKSKECINSPSVTSGSLNDFYFEIYNPGNGTLSMRCTNATGVVTLHSGYPFRSFDRFYSRGYTSSSETLGWLKTWIDDISVNASIGVSTENCGVDVSAYNKENSLIYDFPSYTRMSVLSGRKIIETFYNVPLFTGVFGVSLLISASQYITSYDLNNYLLKINGVDVGNPVCIEVYGREDTYSIFWNCSEALSGTGVLFEFENLVADSSGSFWSSLPVDSISSDGWNSGKDSVGLFNGIYDGYDMNFELQMSFWSSVFEFENESSPYIDLVTSSKTVFNTWDTVPVYYFISDYSYTNSIQLWKGGVQQSIQGFPLTITSGDFNGELSFTPFYNGSYQFRLVRNSVIRSTFNFTVIDPADTDFILAVHPNPCEFNEEVSIGYRFYPDDGAEGFIGISEFSDASNLSEFSEYWLLSANASGNKTFFAQTDMYVSLWKKTGSSYIRLKIKYLKMLSVFDNTINVGYKFIQLSEAVPTVSQRIYGTQVVQGFKTFVRMNNKILQYVTDTPFYNVYVDISKGDNYNVELCVETANGSIVLCSVNFTVSSPAAGGGAGADVFPAEMKLLFGICCILVAVSCPLMISVKYHVAVPTFVYVVFMAFGIGIGTVLGFLELWLVFLFVVALVAGAVFTIFGHGSSGGGGGGGDSGTIRKGGILSRRGSKDYAGASRKADYGVSPKGSPGYLKGPGRRGY